MVGNAGKDIGQPVLRVDAVQLGGLDQGIGDGGGPAALLRAGEQPDEMTVPDSSAQSRKAALVSGIDELEKENGS